MAGEAGRDRIGGSGQAEPRAMERIKSRNQCTKLKEQDEARAI